MPTLYTIPGAFERATAEKALPPLRDLLDTGAVTHRIRLLDENVEREVEVPAIALWLLQHALEEIAKGNGAQVVPVQAELTTQEAADLLNVSRPYLIRLVEAGAIPFTKVGRHRRLRLVDVVAYKTKRDAESAWMMNALAEQGQSIGTV
ncbi:helix-turn-helix domain-containing protein [Pseudomonas serbica]|uniref:helix-turn-helix domain-containing protein n=1 Tax=Pseudomonas serbica TaxID=2965074 RepID=UPI00237B32C1|nr:helix-turn-helix domain-containing protein [Pseudomonas serbica]